MIVLSVDPGLTATGWALWRHGELHACGLARAKDGTDPERAAEICKTLRMIAHNRGAKVGQTVVEFPQAYRAAKSKGDPDDLLRLAALVGAIEMAFPHARHERARPHDWKGAIPKAGKIQEYIVHKRNAAALAAGPGAQAYAAGWQGCPQSLAHNVADAVGLGRWWWDREHAREQSTRRMEASHGRA